MAARTNFRPRRPGYRNELENTAMHGTCTPIREQHNEAPPPYNLYDQTHSQPPRHEVRLPYNVPRSLGRGMGHGTHLDRAQEYHSEPDLPLFGGRGRLHLYAPTVYRNTNYDTAYLDNDPDDSSYRIHNTRDPHHHRRFVPRETRSRQLDSYDGIPTDEMMDLRARGEYSREAHRENRSRSPSRDCGPGSRMRRGFESSLDDFDDALDLRCCGLREFEGARRGTWTQRAGYSSEDDLEEDDNIMEDFRRSRSPTNLYPSRYCSGTGHLFDDFLEHDDFADIHGSRCGTGLYRSGYTYEDESGFDDEHDRIGRTRARIPLRQETDDEISGVERHSPRRHHRIREYAGPRRSGTISTDYNSAGPRREPDSEDENIDPPTQRHVPTNRHHPTSRCIPDSEDERFAQRTQRRRQGKYRIRAPAVHSPDEIFNESIEEATPRKAGNRRTRRGTDRSQALGKSIPPQKHKKPAPTNTNILTSTQLPTRIPTASIRHANPPNTHLAEPRTPTKTPLPKGSADRESREANKQQTHQERGIVKDPVQDIRDAPANGHQQSAQDASAEIGRTSEAELVADSFPDSSDDGYDTPGSSAEGSEDREVLQSFVRIEL